MNPILVQTLYGVGVILFTILILSFFMRGFFFNFLRVRASLGRLVLVKIKGVTRDLFSVGKIEDTFLRFKEAGEEGRVAIQDKSVFYRCLGVVWVDYDVETGSLLKPNYVGITGYDFKKFQSLYLRALYKPTIQSNQEKIMLALCIICVIGVVVAIVLIVMQGEKIQLLQNSINGLRAISGSVSPSPI